MKHVTEIERELLFSHFTQVDLSTFSVRELKFFSLWKMLCDKTYSLKKRYLSKITHFQFMFSSYFSSSSRFRFEFVFGSITLKGFSTWWAFQLGISFQLLKIELKPFVKTQNVQNFNECFEYWTWRQFRFVEVATCIVSHILLSVFYFY